MQNSLTQIFSNNEEKIEYLNNKISELEKRISVQKKAIKGYQEMLEDISDMTSENLDCIQTCANGIKNASETMADAVKLIAKLRNEIQAI